MKKIAVLLILASLSLQAHAKWTEVDKGEQDTSYIDVENIKRSGNIVRVWSLLDYPTPRGNGAQQHSSMVALQEFDCAEEKIRLLQYLAYRGNMAGGELVASKTKTQDWMYVRPGSVFASQIGIACKAP